MSESKPEVETEVETELVTESAAEVETESVAEVVAEVEVANGAEVAESAVEVATTNEPQVASDDADTPVEMQIEEVLPLEPDLVLLHSRDIARAALAEITDAQTIGVDDGHEVHEQHVLTLYFESRLPGYPGWRWAATLTRIDEDSAVNVLEVELLPGEGAVTAPEWVPWSERLAQYRETQSRQATEEAAEAEAAAAELAEEDEVDPEDDVLENDYSDFEDEIDGVSIDEDSDEDSDDESDSGTDEDDDDSEDESDDETDDDGFSDLDEHDLHDHGDDEVDFESNEEE